MAFEKTNEGWVPKGLGAQDRDEVTKVLGLRQPKRRGGELNFKKNFDLTSKSVFAM